jgi:hypothetical protein
MHEGKCLLCVLFLRSQPSTQMREREKPFMPYVAINAIQSIMDECVYMLREKSTPLDLHKYFSHISRHCEYFIAVCFFCICRLMLLIYRLTDFHKFSSTNCGIKLDNYFGFFLLLLCGGPISRALISSTLFIEFFFHLYCFSKRANEPSSTEN